MSLNTFRRTGLLVALFAAAFGIRLACQLAWGGLREGPPASASGDDFQFNQLALHVSQGDGYRLTPDEAPTSFRAPGFPLLLALVYRVLGPSYLAAHLLFCLLGAAACVFTYLLAREVLTEAGAWIAALLLAFYLPHAYFATAFSSENVYIPCLTLGLWLFLRGSRTQSPALLLLAGLVLGWAALTRPAALIVLLLLCLTLLPGLWRAPRRQLVAGVALVGAFGCVLLPWILRNYRVHHQLVLIATNGGSTFYGANNDRVAGEVKSLGYWVPTTDLPHRDLIEAQPNEVAHDKMEWQLGMSWVKAHPGKAALLEGFKLGRFWWLPDYGPGLRWLRIASYVPFLVLFVIGFWRCLRERALWTWPWWALHATVLAALVTTLVFFGEPRFRDAVAPVLMIYAATAFGMRFVQESAALSKSPTTSASHPRRMVVAWDTRPTTPALASNASVSNVE